MKKITSLFALLVATCSVGFSQQVTGRLHFGQGQTFDILLQVKTAIGQQAMGQTMEFNVEASANHSYKVSNATEDNTTLNHRMQRIRFNFDGMGQKRGFDSDVEKDINGQMGKPIKDMLEKKYDIIIDTGGTVKLAMPESIKLAEGDSRMAIIGSMLKDVTDLVQPPKKGSASFFKIFPEGQAGKGATWTTTEMSNGGKKECAYVIAEITDSTIVIDYAETSNSVTKAEMMGNETTTKLSSKGKGKIIVDRATGIMKEKTVTTDATGTTESSFGNMPVTSKTTTTITVTPRAE